MYILKMETSRFPDGWKIKRGFRSDPKVLGLYYLMKRIAINQEGKDNRRKKSAGEDQINF